MDKVWLEKQLKLDYKDYLKLKEKLGTESDYFGASIYLMESMFDALEKSGITIKEG